MYIWHTLVSLFQYEFGLTAIIFLCACFLLGFIMQTLHLHRMQGKRRWTPMIIIGTVAVTCEICLWLIHNYVALIFMELLYFTLTAFIGTVVGWLSYLGWNWRKNRQKNREETSDT